MPRPLCKYLPPALQSIDELEAITENGEQPEIDMLRNAIASAQKNLFLQSAEEHGIARWEKMLGIHPHSTDTLEERRFSILAQLRDQRPTTFIFLKRQLSALCGEDGFTLKISTEEYMLTVRLALTAKSNVQAVRRLIEAIKPANIAVDLDLLYNRNSKFDHMTHAQLTAYTHETLRSEVINSDGNTALSS